MTLHVWKPLGPACVRQRVPGKVMAGRFNAVAVDPTDPTGKSVYAGAASGGLWHTTDGGITWDAIGDKLATLAISTIVVDLTSAGKFLFVGTGERRSPFAPAGRGVLVSPDGGTTWDPLPDASPLSGRRINALAVDSSVLADDGGHRRIWAATDSGLWITEGRGRSWSLADGAPWSSLGYSNGTLIGARPGVGVFRNAGSQQSTSVLSAVTSEHVVVAVAPSNPSVIYAATVDDAKNTVTVHYSEDGGTTWQPRKAPDTNVQQIRVNEAFMTVHPGDPKRVYLVLRGHIFHTFDGGKDKDWEFVSDTISNPISDTVSPTIKGAEVAGVALLPVAPFTAWVAASDGIYVSFTEGTRTPPVDSIDLPEDEGGEEESEEEESEDAEPDDAHVTPPDPHVPAWEHRKRNLATMQLTALAQHPTERSILLAAAGDQGMLRYRAHPLWSRTSESQIFRVAIDPNEPTTWYATSNYRTLATEAVFQSKDAGTTWTGISMGLQFGDLSRYIDYSQLCPLVVDPSQKGIVYFGTENLYRRDDAHPEAGWVLVSGTADDGEKLRESAITAIAVAPSDPNVIYVGTLAGTVLHIANRQGIFTTLHRFIDTTLLDSLLQPFQIVGGTTGFGRPISSIAVLPDDPESLYVTTRAGVSVQQQTTTDSSTPSSSPAPPPPKLVWLFDSGDAARNFRMIPLVPLPTLPDPASTLPDDLIVNKVVLEPNEPSRLFLATDRGVLAISISADGFPARSADFNDNLPHAAVTDLAIFPPGLAAQPGALRVLRAATFGRGAWERVLDKPKGLDQPEDLAELEDANIDIYVRDNLLDTGEAVTPEAPRPDPVVPGTQLAPTDALDLKVDRPTPAGHFLRPVSNYRYLASNDPAAVADYIGFEAFERESPQADLVVHVYLQVHNRGPSTARVKARVLFARRDPGDASQGHLPSDPFGTIDPGSDWQPVGDTQEVDVRPGEPTVVRWPWQVPRDLAVHVSLAGVISATDDPLAVNTNGTALQNALDDKRVLVRRMDVLAPRPLKRAENDDGFFRWWMIPIGIGLAYLVIDALDIEPLDALDLI